MIFLDGNGFAGGGMRIPVVLDNLIAKAELPPMAAIFINPGVLAPTSPDTQSDWLYASEEGKLYRRHTKRKGAVAWEPVKPPQPSL